MKNISALPIKGIIPPMVTPLLPDQSLDMESIPKLIEHLISGGVHGIFILGTTGEAASLPVDVRENFIEEVLRNVQNRIPVLVGITDSSEEVSLRLANRALDFGATALVSAPPFYYTLSQQELLKYYRNLADNLPLPLFLYNMPSHTKMVFDVQTVVELAQHPNIIGLKDSSANTQYFQKIQYSLRDTPYFSLLVGPEEIMAETVLMGGHGGVNGGANLFPHLYVNLYEAALDRDFSRLISLQEKVMEISCNLYTIGPEQSSYLRGLKAGLSYFGICNDFLASPLFPFSKDEKLILQERINRLGWNFEEMLSPVQ